MTGPSISPALGNDLKLAVLVLSLGLDTFTVAVSLGMAGIVRKDRIRAGLSFSVFEGGMPLAGFLAGRLLSSAVGDIAAWIGSFALCAIGVYMVVESLSGTEGTNVSVDSWPGVLVTSLSISLDELAVGFGMGALRLPIALAVASIAGQAFVLTVVGTKLGNRIGERLARRAGLGAGVLLATFGAALAVEKLAGV